MVDWTDKVGRDWIDKVGRDLGHVCNGDVTKDASGAYVCKMNNGEIRANMSLDGDARMLQASKRVGTRTQNIKMESYSDEMVITRSLSGSIEFLHRMGNNPEVRIEQDGKNLGDITINAYNPDVKTFVYGSF